MNYRIAADFLVLLHFCFILFVMFGGLLVLWRPRWAWLHLPAVVWGTVVEFTGWICPLTPWEQAFRRLAGQRGYEGGFIGHYLQALIYPAGLTPKIQIFLGVLVLMINLAIYFCAVRRFSGITGKKNAEFHEP